MGQEAASGVPTRILLCDDTRDIILLLGAEFEMHGDLEVVGEAANGREAVDLAASVQPDVVVLDLAMPEMDGLQALPEILNAAPQTKIVVLSGQEARSLAPKVISLGAQRYVEKGTSALEIAEIVRQVARAS